MEGNTALGASSPAKPALTMPEPLSHTIAETSPSSTQNKREISVSVQSIVGIVRASDQRRSRQLQLKLLSQPGRNRDSVWLYNATRN